MSRAKRPLQRKLRFEDLESRRLLTGNVTAKVSAFNLNLTGDAQNNAITITQMGVNTYCISGQDGTTINGQSKISVTGVKNNVNVTFLNGSDSLVLTDASFPADVTVKMGNGTDLVQVGFSSDREFGSDSVSVHHNLSITLGNGSDNEVEESDLYVGHDQNVTLGNGNNAVVLLGESGSVDGYSSEFAVQVAHDFNITLGNGNNDLVNLADLNVCLYSYDPQPDQVESGGAITADQSPSGGESVDVGHDFNITFGKGNGDSVIINDNTEFDGITEGSVANDTSLVTVGHDFHVVMGNGNYDNVTFNVTTTTDGGDDGGDEVALAPADDGGEASVVDGTLLAVGHDVTVTLGNGNFDSVSPSGTVSSWEGEVTYNSEPFVSVGHDANITLGSGHNDSVGASLPQTETENSPAVRSLGVAEDEFFAVVVNHDFNVRLGGGMCDNVELLDLLVGHNLSVTEGNGTGDNVSLEDVDVCANLAVTTGNGGDTVSLDYVEAFQANITTGSGKDSVSISDESDFAKLYVSEGAGNDCLFVDSSTYVSQIAYFDGGTGTNSFFGSGPFGPATVTKKHY